MQKAELKRPKSHASWVIEQVQLGAKGAFRGFAKLADAQQCLEVFEDDDGSRFLWCKCGVKLGTRVNVWQGHFGTVGHKDGMAKAAKQMHLAAVLVDEVAEAAKRQRMADDLLAHRIRVAKAVYSSSLSAAHS